MPVDPRPPTRAVAATTEREGRLTTAARGGDSSRDAPPRASRDHAGQRLDHSGRRLRVGVVGGGLISQLVHLPLLRALDERFELVALADPSPVVRERLGARYGIAHIAEDHGALLDHRLDALVVCSPNGAHAEAVLDALDAGVHVLVEKPLCLDVADADRIVARADERGLVVQVGYMKRFDPAYERMCDDLRRARPAVRHVSTLTIDPGLSLRFRPPGFVAADDVPAAARARLERETAAQVAAAVGADDPSSVRSFSEAFLGALIHDVNLVRGLLDAEPTRVVDAHAERDATAAGLTCELPDGGRWSAAWMLARAGRFAENITLVGDDGVRRLRFPAPYLRGAGAHASLVAEHGGWTCATEGADAYARELEHFHACVTRGEPCRTPAAQARHDIALLTAAYRSLDAELVA